MSRFVRGWNPRGTLRFKADVQGRIAELLTASSPQNLHEAMAAIVQRAQTDAAFRSSLVRAGINLSKVAALQFAGQNADPLPLENEDGEVLLGFENNENTGGNDAPVYGKPGTTWESN